MKTRMIPPILMLSAGAICSIVMYLKQYELRQLLIVLLAVLVVFYAAGLCIRAVMESFKQANEDRVAEEGEVIEKEAGDAEEPAEGETAEGEAGQKEKE